jgi:hypothetical protein
MDWNKLILDHVTVPKPPVTEVGWRVRRTDTTTRFEVTTDDGDTWTQTHSWDCPTAGDVVRAGYAIFAKHPGARITEFEEVNGVWIPRIEEEEAE